MVTNLQRVPLAFASAVTTIAVGAIPRSPAALLAGAAAWIFNKHAVTQPLFLRCVKLDSNRESLSLRVAEVERIVTILFRRVSRAIIVPVVRPIT